ncbi:unnamed protein product [Dibothriocephalus latus]|uniref:Uncharacterized protein n=1 Tax=Dibothriocephalus latus TaxID=60516 RepID=A0A3P7NT83_DIBLA|nr:unnamed protein product [Dibothriocephalus latus]
MPLVPIQRANFYQFLSSITARASAEDPPVSVPSSTKTLAGSRTASQSKLQQISSSLGNLFAWGKRSRRRVGGYSSQDNVAVADAAENEVADREVDGTSVHDNNEDPVVFSLSNNADAEGGAGPSAVAESETDHARHSTNLMEGYSNLHAQTRATTGYTRLANGRPLSVVAESSQASQASDSRRQGPIIGGIPYLGPSATTISSPHRVTPLADSGMRGSARGPPADRPPSNTPDGKYRPSLPFDNSLFSTFP